jgi:hypothetical protein
MTQHRAGGPSPRDAYLPLREGAPGVRILGPETSIRCGRHGYDDLRRMFNEHELFSTTFYRQRTRYRIRQRLLRGKVLRIFYGRNDVDREIATSLTDGNTYYTLAYSPANKDFHGEFRKLKITVINRPDLKVQTRDGYYAMPDNQTANPKREFQELSGSLVTPIPFNGIRIPISYTRLVKSPAPHISVRFVIPSTSLSWAPDTKGRLSAQITIASADKGKHGAWKPSMIRVYTVSLPDGATPSAATQTSVHFQMPYRDSNQLRFVVRDDATGRIGSSEIALHPA